MIGPWADKKRKLFQVFQTHLPRNDCCDEGEANAFTNNCVHKLQCMWRKLDQKFRIFQKLQIAAVRPMYTRAIMRGKYRACVFAEQCDLQC